MVTLDVNELEALAKKLRKLKNALFSPIDDRELHKARMSVLFQIDDISGVLHDNGFPDMATPRNIYSLEDYRS